MGLELAKLIFPLLYWGHGYVGVSEASCVKYTREIRDSDLLSSPELEERFPLISLN